MGKQQTSTYHKSQMSTTIRRIRLPQVHQMMTKCINKQSLWEERITSCLRSSSGEEIQRVFRELLQEPSKETPHSVLGYNSTILGQAKSTTAGVKLQPAIDSLQCSPNKSRKSLILSKWYVLYHSIFRTHTNQKQEMEVHENSKIYTHFF